MFEHRLRWHCAVLALAAAATWSGGRARGQLAAEPETVSISAADAEVAVDRATGRAVSIRVAGEEMARSHPAGSERPFGFVEVVDLRDGRRYTPIHVASTVSGWKLEATGSSKALRFTQQYESAPFSIAHTLSQSPAGIRWEVSLRLLEGQRQNRSVEVAWMLPLPFGWRFWGPNDTVSYRTNGVSPYQYVYAHTDHAPYATIIPLVGVWGRRGGAAVFSPPDARKVQIIMSVYTQTISDPPNGVFRKVEDLQMLRVAHHMIGLRPGRELRLAICLAGCRPDWRAVMGHYVNCYPELFEPIPEARKYEGMYGITNASRLKGQSVDSFKAQGITALEVHGHFPEYGVYVTPEALENPDLRWYCKPHRVAELSLADNRRSLEKLLAAGVAPFMYFYNVHADAETIRRRFASDMMRNEQGRPNIQYHTQPALRAQPDSPFGEHLLRQMDLMLRAYPKMPGLFVDNFTIQWLDFANDDGLTMVHHRPAYDMNRNHQDVGTACFEKAHKAGKVIMVNKLGTIESARGADMVLVENMSVDGLTGAMPATSAHLGRHAGGDPRPPQRLGDDPGLQAPDRRDGRQALGVRSRSGSPARWV